MPSPADPVPEKNRTIAIVLLLIVVDVLLLLGNVGHYLANDPTETETRFSAPLWNGNFDGSYIEVVGHVQIIAVVVLLLSLAVVRRTFIHAAWALAFTGLFLDDFLLIHERVGEVLADTLALPRIAGLRAVDLGELMVWAGEAAILGAIVIVATILAPPQDRRVSKVLFACMAVIAVFGVAVDQLHIIAEPHLPRFAVLALTMTETAGELGGMSLALVAVHRMFTSRTRVTAQSPGPAANPAEQPEPTRARRPVATQLPH